MDAIITDYSFTYHCGGVDRPPVPYVTWNDEGRASAISSRRGNGVFVVVGVELGDQLAATGDAGLVEAALHVVADGVRGRSGGAV